MLVIMITISVHLYILKKNYPTDFVSGLKTTNESCDQINIDKILNDVVGTAFTKNRFFTKSITEDEIAFHLIFTNLCNTLTK